MILASASPRRRELLSSLGAVFSVKVCDVPELDGSCGSVPPFEVPQINACRKAAAVAEKFPDEIVIGADTVIIFEDRIFGKPRDLADAAEMLNRFSGKTHSVVTAVAIIGKTAGILRCWSETSVVRFKTLTPELIRSYLEQVDVLDKAGAYALQEHGESIIESVDGETANVIGLPLKKLQQELVLLGLLR